MHRRLSKLAHYSSSSYRLLHDVNCFKTDVSELSLNPNLKGQTVQEEAFLIQLTLENRADR